MRDTGYRLCGFGVLAAAGISTMIHRSVYEASRNGPATVAEFALGLTSFVLGCLGVLLLVHGKKLLTRDDNRTGRAMPGQSHDLRSRLVESIGPAGRAYDTRYGALLMKEQHAIACAKAQAGRHMVAELERHHYRNRVTVRSGR